MQCRCPACQAEFSYEGEAPRFCSRCGSSLSTVTGTPLEATGIYTPQENTYVHRGDNGQPFAAPDQVGGYRLLKKLGAGGMGAVYEAEDMASGQKVALKLIKRGSDLSDSATQRFRQEGRLASSISHPRCVFVIAADEDRGQPYIVMELMPGQTFIDLVKAKGPLPPNQAVALIHDIIQGLQEAHRLGLVHRDVKPANCFLDEHGRAKIGDFGLAKVLEQSSATEAPTAVQLTGTGTFIGTPLYAAPEQIKGQHIDQQVDVYAVGATLYYLLTGKAPFEDQQSVTAVLARIVSEDPDPIHESRTDLPAGLETLVFKALERDRSKRFRDLEAMRQALQPFMPDRTRIVRFGSRMAAFAVDYMVAMIGMGIIGILLGELFLHTTSKDFQEGIDLLFGDSFWSTLILSILTQSLFFMLPEMRWGTTLGKWCFRLRLVDPQKGGRPGVRQVFLRNLVFMLSGLLLEWVLLGFNIQLNSKPSLQVKNEQTETKEGWHLDAGDTFLSSLAGLVLVSLTMRRRNGYRGLHELLSGTATIWLPVPPPRTTLDMARLAQVMPAKAKLLPEPYHLGSFLVTHELWRSEDQCVLIGKDERLSRLVWIWLRPVACYGFDAKRRSVSRPTRWRWLGSGQQGEQCWDAFLATPGITLQSLVDQRLTLDWTGTYHLLRELSDELHAASQDASIPPFRSMDQLWLQQRGGAQWLDVPTTPSSTIHIATSEMELLRFLGQAGKFALEGPLSLSTQTLHRAIPQGAFELMEKLLAEPVQISSLDEFRQSLTHLADRPFSVGRWARFRALALQGIWLLILIPLCFAFTAGIAILVQSRSGEWNNWKENMAQFKVLSPLIMPVAILIFSIIWSMWFRGRWSFGLMGLAIRRHDGQPAERWRLAWRTLLIIGPFVLFQLLSLLPPWTTRWLGMMIHWNQAPQLVLIVVTVIWLIARPHRAWHDRLAGTVIVPT